MRLITTGDCATSGDFTWAKRLADLTNRELINLAEPGSQNSLQIKIMQDFILNDEIRKDDIIIWEVCDTWKPHVRITNVYKDKADRANRLLQKHRYVHYHTSRYRNKIDNEHRLDLLSSSPMLRDFINKEFEDEAQCLEDIFFMLIVLKIMCPQTMIIRGSTNETPKQQYWEKLRILLKEKNIEYIDDSIGDWCRDENLEFVDPVHPTEASMHVFAERVMYTKLKELGWI